jgi:DNA (cytosine-5)-methyltransferase 1
MGSYFAYGSVCSGIEAATTAWHPLGWIPAWFAEIEPFPSAVLAHHWSQVPNLGDFTAIRGDIAAGTVEAPDVLVGGTPCQAFSVAGLRQSLDDKRGQLTLEFVRLADAIDSARSIRGARPCTVVWENVPGVLNTPDNAFGCFLAGLVGEDDALEPPGGRWTNAGYVRGPRRAVAWRILDAQYFGVAQRRRRVFVVASARKGFDPATVLFEWDGVRRDSPPSREAGKGSSPDAARRSGERSHVVAYAIQERAAHPNLNAGPGGKGFQEAVAYTLEARHHVQACAVTGDVFHTLRAEGHDASEDGTGRGVGAVAIAFSSKDHGADAGSIAPTMRSMGHDGSHANGGGQLAVAVALRGREGGATAEVGDDAAFTLRASTGGGDKPHAMVGMQVRRLTPTECERLQGFPDGHTRIPWRGKPSEDCPDGPRYKALGNSMAVPVMRWIGARIARELEVC